MPVVIGLFTLPPGSIFLSGTKRTLASDLGPECHFELAQGPLKACLTGRRQREEMKAPNAYGFGASAFRTCVPR
jgi:hypothetical protein